MLPPYIIEQIRRREDEHRHQPVQPQLEMPMPSSMPMTIVPERTDDEEHGVIIIDL